MFKNCCIYEYRMHVEFNDIDLYNIQFFIEPVNCRACHQFFAFFIQLTLFLYDCW